MELNRCAAQNDQAGQSRKVSGAPLSGPGRGTLVWATCWPTGLDHGQDGRSRGRGLCRETRSAFFRSSDKGPISTNKGTDGAPGPRIAGRLPPQVPRRCGHRRSGAQGAAGQPVRPAKNRQAAAGVLTIDRGRCAEGAKSSAAQRAGWRHSASKDRFRRRASGQ